MSDETMKYLEDKDVQAALHCDKGKGASLRSWSLEDFTNKFDGYTSTIKNVRVKYTSGGQEEEACYVLKVNHSKGTDSEYFMSLIFSHEHNFYTEVIPALDSILKEIGFTPLSFPKCFYSRMEESVDLFLLENLKAKGYQMQNKGRGIDTVHASLVLKELAKLHAASALLQAKTPDEDLLDRFSCLQKEWTQEYNLGMDFGGYMDNLLDIGQAMFEKFGDCEKVVKWLKKIRPNAWKMYDEHLVRNPPFAVILHGDVWINNMLFMYDSSGKNPIEVKFLDLQGCRKASLGLDLQHFLNLNVPGPERVTNLPSLLSTYHTSFDEVMKAGGSQVPFTIEQLQQEYIDRGFFGVMYTIMFLPDMVRRKEEACDIFAEGKDAQMSNVLNMVDNNPLLRQRIMSVIEEWIERGLIS